MGRGIIKEKEIQCSILEEVVPKKKDFFWFVCVFFLQKAGKLNIRERDILPLEEQNRGKKGTWMSRSLSVPQKFQEI